MAELFYNSFPVNSVTSGLDGITYLGSPTLATTNPHSTTGSDNRHMTVGTLSSGAAKGCYVIAGLNAQGPYYKSHWFQWPTWPGADNDVILVLDTATTGYVQVKVGSTGLLKLYNQTTQVGSNYQLSLNTYYQLVLYIDKTPAAGSEVLRLYVGTIGSAAPTEVAGASNLTLTLAGVTYWMMGMNLASEANTTGLEYVDDFELNDTTGTQRTGLPSESYQVSLWPNTTGDFNQWARGGADSGANWSQVDENPHNDDTDYVSSNALNDKDLFNITDPTFDPGATIHVVQLVARRRGAGASANATATSIIKSIAEKDGNTFTDANNVYDIQVCGMEYFQSDGSTAWTKTAITNAQIGYRLSTTSTNALIISNFRIDVLFRPTGIKTINGLAKASVKTANGLAIDSMKTWNGLR